MTRRDVLIVAGLLIVLWLLSQRSAGAGTVRATIFGADVAPGVDVTPGGPSPEPDTFDDDDWPE